MAQGSAFGPMDGVDGVDGVDGAEALDLLGGGGRQSVFRPIGVGPEFHRRANEADYRGHRWPPRLPNTQWPPAVGAQPAAWPIASDAIARRLTDFTPDNASLLVVAELVQLKDNANQLAWTQLMAAGDMAADIAAQGPGGAGGTVAMELAELRLLAQFRAGAMAEALAQRSGIIGYFRGVLQFSLATHPYTYYLAAAALRVGQFLCMHYKGQFNRPRPGRLDPSLMPQIDPPGHSAYPSGHSLQSFLIAHCMEQVVPTAITTGTMVPSPYLMLAQRIAKLREVLGVHYPSDSAAGRRVAEKTFPLLLDCGLVKGSAGPGVNNFTVTFGGTNYTLHDNGWLGLARKEWEPR